MWTDVCDRLTDLFWIKGRARCIEVKFAIVSMIYEDLITIDKGTHAGNVRSCIGTVRS